MQELDLFRPEQTTEIPERLLEARKNLLKLAAKNIYYGSSSWKYESWWTRSRKSLTAAEHEQKSTPIYFQDYSSKKEFEHRCLEEYAETFPFVGGDFSFYQIPTQELCHKLEAQTPSHFRFLLKVTDVFTLKKFLNLPRFGKNAGNPNPDFLNVKKFEDEFLSSVSIFKEKMGLIVFEFSPFSKNTFGNGLPDFLNVLENFFSKVSKKFKYGVEIRNKEFFTKEFLKTVVDLDVTPVLNSWTKMPPLNKQWELLKEFEPPILAVRAMNKPGRTHEEAVKLFDPYDEVKSRYWQARDVLKEMQFEVEKSRGKRKGYFILNNHLEGCASESVLELVE